LANNLVTKEELAAAYADAANAAADAAFNVNNVYNAQIDKLLTYF